MGQWEVDCDRGPIVVFWSHGEQRRVIIPIGWAEAKTLWKRILGRFQGGLRHYADAQGALGRLAQSGASVSAKFDGHLVGLARAYRHGDVGGSDPVMICKERGPTGREPRVPILVASVESARDLVSRYRACGVGVADWHCYMAEHLDVPAEKLFRKNPNGSVVGRTVLEDDLVACFGPQGRRRQTFPPLPAYTHAHVPALDGESEPRPLTVAHSPLEDL